MAVLVGVFVVGEFGFVGAQLGIEFSSYDQHVMCRNRSQVDGSAL